MHSTQLLFSGHLRKLGFCLCIAACMIFLFGRTLHAQNSYGSAVGTITDGSGAIVVGAKITLTNVGTGDKRIATANSVGDYQFVNLAPGNYRIEVTNSGFKRFVQDNVVVQVQNSTRVDAALQLGTMDQTVEVSSQAAMIETQSATIGQVVAGRTVSELPLNGRNVFNLLAIAPGVVPQGGTAAANAASGSAGNGFGTGNYQISGGIPNTEADFIDGAPINNGYINAIAYIPSQDSIQEFNILANNIPVEFGSTEDGVVTMITKSGTNAFHGSAFDFLRNTVLNANTFFGDRAHLKVPVFIQNQYGATLGGPIKRDKLFFFGSYEGVHAAVGATTAYSVPSLAQRNGDFSSVATPITDPGQFNAAGVFIPAPAGTTFPGNKIPASRINPTATALLPFWALPQTTAATNNYTVNTTTHPTLNQYIARIDWNASERQRFFGRYTYHVYNAPGALPYGFINNPSLSHNAVQNFVLGDNVTINQKTILNFTLSYFRDSSFSGQTGIPFDIGFLGWPSATVAQLNGPVIPRISVSGLSLNGGGGQQIRVTEENYAIAGSVTRTVGRHLLRFGGEFRRAPNNYGQTNSTFVEAFNFNTAFTGNPFASYLLGLPQATTTENATFPAAMMYYAGAYLGDTFQATSKLTINAGIRWEYPGYWTERHDRQTVFLPNEANPLAGPTGLPLTGNVELVNTPAYPYRTNVKPHYDLFSPRVGLAYRFTERTVLRSGYSILVAPTAAIEQDAQPYQSPLNLALTTVNPTTQPVNSLSNPFPGGVLQTVGRSPNYQSVVLGQSVTTAIPNAPSTYVEQWNVDLEQDLGHETLFDLAYVADHGVHQQGPAGLNDNGQGLDQIPDQYLSMGSALLNPVSNPFYGLVGNGSPIAGTTIPAGQLLRPYPQYYNLFNPASVGYFSKYAALQTKLQKRFGAGGTLLAAYTWAKNSGNSDTQTGFQEGVQPGEVQDWTNLRAEVSQLSYNVPQRAVISYVLDLPVGKGKRFLGDKSGALDRVVSGWGVDGITTFQTGFPLVFTAQPTFASSNFGAGTPRPNVVSGCLKSKSGSAYSKVSGWFNTSCFTQTPQYGFGNEPRVDPSLRMQGIANWDFALFKATQISEGIKLQFRTEIFNMFNRVQFGYPNQLCCSNTNASFGVISSQNNAPRQIQFALRLTY